MIKHRKISLFRCTFIVLLCFFVVQIIEQEIKIYHLNNEINATRTKVAELTRQYEKMQEEQKSVNDPSYIEKVAREHYNMVKKEEMPVLVKE
ncbi:MAG: septum formation initiator family protein [Acidaminococcales bacterium]|jgi:cell division protein FtsL|nr:septum formation initiator family protein [Acidaminococcales bacterium]